MLAVDWDRINELRADIGEEDFADVALLFVSELHEAFEGLLSNPGAATDAEFHFLRGGAANLGFQAVVDACDVAERTYLSGGTPDVGAVHRAFKAAMAEITVQFPILGSAA